MSKVLDQKLLKSAIIFFSEAQWYLVCTKIVNCIRAVQFWIIYYKSGLSEPSYNVLVKQFITFFYFPGEGVLPAHQNLPPFCGEGSNFDGSCA